MHEAAIAESILKVASARFKNEQDAVAVRSVSVIAGEFRNVDGESLDFAFNSLKSNYDGLGDCRLNVMTIAAQARCLAQGHAYHPSFSAGFCCPQCGSGIGDLMAGEELHVTNIEIETAARAKLKRSIGEN